MWRKWCQQFGLWLAHVGGWDVQKITAPYEQRIHSLLADIADHPEMKQLAALRARIATSATVSPEVFTRAQELTSAANATALGGEAKRHAVYARLIKDFPDKSKRELALAIELALFHAPKEG